MDPNLIIETLGRRNNKNSDHIIIPIILKKQKLRIKTKSKAIIYYLLDDVQNFYYLLELYVKIFIGIICKNIYWNYICKIIAHFFD